MPIDTNLNVSPYFDDYDEAKNFHRILFRPAVAVQARELTQLQSILQNQIERFGDNIYVEGTVIKGCSLTTDYVYYYVKIRDLQADGQTANPAGYTNTLIVDTSSNLSAIVVNFKTGLESQDPDLNTLYVKYINTGTSEEKVFSNNQLLTIYDRDRTLEAIAVTSGGTGYSNSDTVVISGGGGTGASASLTTFANGTISTVTITAKGSGYTSNPSVSITTSTGSSATLTPRIFKAQVTSANSTFTAPIGTGTAVKTTEGVIYQKGNFIRVDAQEEILSKYSTAPSNVAVGFVVNESIVNNSVDTSLLDNASGSSNFAAPGAFRLKLTPTLTVVDRATAISNTDFLSLLEFENGNIVKDRTQTQFNSVRKELSKRTSEESGNFTVTAFPFDTATTGNTSHFFLTAGAGVAYVDGNRIELLNNIRIPVEKGTDTLTTPSQDISTTYGNYVEIEELLGVFDVKSGATVTLRNTAADDASDNAGGTPTNPGLQIGTAKVRSLVYSSGIQGTPSCRYRIYLFDIKMAQGYSFKDTRSISSAGVGVADVVLVSGDAVVRDFDNDILVFKSGAYAVKEFNEEQFIFRSSTNNTILTTGRVSLTFSGGNTLPHGVTDDATDTIKNNFIVIPTTTLVSDTNKSGTVAVANSTTLNVSGTSTSFSTEYEVGDFIRIGTSTPRRITAIFNNSLLSVSVNPGSTGATNHTVAYPANLPIDFTKRGKVLEIDSSTTCTFDIGHGLTSTGTVVVYHDMRNLEPAVKQKALNNSVFVKLSTDSLKASLNGPWCLGVPDVLKINGIYIGTGATYASTSTTNYKDEFILDNGQKDNYYGLAYLRLKPRGAVSLTTDTNILVELDCFTHGSGKYISTESYPVDDTSSPAANTITTALIPNFTSPASGEVFSLRDSLDFRPIVSNTAVLSTTTGGATEDPITTETLVSGEKFFPSPTRSFAASIDTFLPRIDRIVMDGTGQIRVVKGIPSLNPSVPSAEKGSMDLGYLKVAPYPSLTAKEAKTAKRPDLSNYVILNSIRRYTMKDIGTLEQRIKQLEYYTSLNTLETDTKNLTLISENDPTVERFKNGFFVDSFNNYDISNLDDPEYKAQITSRDSVLTPIKEVTDIQLQYSSGGEKTLDLVTLPYTEETLIEQPWANKERTLVEELYSFKGALLVHPNFDNFFDTNITATSSIDVDIATPMESLVSSVNDALSQFVIASEVAGVSESEVESWFEKNKRGHGGTQFVNKNISTTYNDIKAKINIPTSVSNSKDIGSFLTSVSINPYIRPQKIGFAASGLRPNARHYVYMDGRAMADTTEPAEVIRFEVALDALEATGGIGDPIVANSIGQCAGFIYIPPDTFTAGEKTILIMDVDSLNAETSATSKATAKYTAFSLTGDATRVTYSTRSFDTSPGPNIFSATTFSEQGATVVENVTESYASDPLSQTFRVQPRNDGTETIFLTSVDLYFKQKDPTVGVSVELREVSESGYPTTSILPFSKVHKPSSQVSVSPTAISATTFTFQSPVAVTAGRDYALVILPDNNSPEYRIWTAQTGLNDVGQPSRQMSQSWGLGTLFYSVSGSAFTAVQNEDLKFKLRYAQFDSLAESIVLKNADQEFLTIANTVGNFTGGEDVGQLGTSYINSSLTTYTTVKYVTTSTDLSSTVGDGDWLTIIYDTSRSTSANVSVSGTEVTNTTSIDFTTSFTAGDFIKIGNTTAKDIRQVVSITNSTHMVIDAETLNSYTNHNIFSIVPKFDVVQVKSSNSTAIVIDRPCSYDSSQGPTSTISNSFQKTVTGRVSLFNNAKNKLTLTNSNASNSNFLVKTSNNTYRATVVGSKSGAVTKVSSVDNISISAFKPLVNFLLLRGTSMNANGTFTKAAGGTYNKQVNLRGDNFFDIDDDVLVKSKTNEISGTTITKSLTLTLNMSSSVNDTSPVIDTVSQSVAGLTYQINNDTTGENTSYGNSSAKYISKNLVLSEGLDAEDVKVFLTAYKPVGTEIKIYAKILNSSDGEPLDTKNWSELALESEQVFSSPNDPSDLREYQYTFKRSPASVVLPGTVQSYSNTTIEGNETFFISSFNANSDVSNTSNFIDTAVASADSKFVDGDVLTYIVESTNTVLSELESQFGIEVSTASVSSGGSGYSNGDIVALNTGTGSPALFTVTTGSADTIATTLAFQSRGFYSVAPSSPSTTTAQSGSGSGLTVTNTTRTLHGPYYAVSTNTTGVSLSTTLGGDAISLNKGATEAGHYLSILNSKDLVKIVKTDSLLDYEIIPVSAVIDANTIVLSDSVTHSTSGMVIEKVTLPQEAFKYCNNPVGDNIVRYYDSNLSAYDTYKVMAIKIVMLSETSYKVPRVQDVRAIATSI